MRTRLKCINHLLFIIILLNSYESWCDYKINIDNPTFRKLKTAVAKIEVKESTDLDTVQFAKKSRQKFNFIVFYLNKKFTKIIKYLTILLLNYLL